MHAWQVLFQRLPQLIVTLDSKGVTAWKENALAALEPHTTAIDRVWRLLPVLQSSQFVALCTDGVIKVSDVPAQQNKRKIGLLRYDKFFSWVAGPDRIFRVTQVPYLVQKYLIRSHSPILY